MGIVPSYDAALLGFTRCLQVTACFILAMHALLLSGGWKLIRLPGVFYRCPLYTEDHSSIGTRGGKNLASDPSWR